MTTATKVLDYDKLVQAYNTNLDVTLRGFRPAEEMLDTWVPDDDASRSLSSLVEAAQIGGSDAVTIRVSNKILAGQSVPAVTDKLSSLGQVETSEENGSVVFTVLNLQETALFRSIRSLYHQRLRTRFPELRFKRPLRVEGNQIPLRASEEHCTLAWAVQTDKHIIADAVFDSAVRGPMPAALDQLCEILIGLPVQEARDHGVIRLEFALRDSRQTRPIPGIVLPQNADPIFRLPSVLVNRLFIDYQTSTNYRESSNFFDPGPSASWAALTPPEREQRVSDALSAYGSGIGIENGEVQVVECKHPYAVTVRFGDKLAINAKRTLALAIERLVRQYCDPRLEVFCEEKKDLSKLRRLTEKAN